MRIVIEIIPHDHQRYPTVGDWRWLPSGDLEIKVSRLKSWRYEFLVAIHEFIEAVLCKHANIKEEDVSNFDIVYEAQRPAGDTSEPGDSPLAPYKTQHFLATSIERILAFALGVDWTQYEETLDSL